MYKRALGNWIIKRENLLQMGPRATKLADKQEALTSHPMPQNEPSGIVALAAQTQQILGQALRQIKFTAIYVIVRLPIRNVKELRGRTQLVPQFSRAGQGMALFRCRLALDIAHRCDKGAPEFELLLLALSVFRQ